MLPDGKIGSLMYIILSTPKKWIHGSIPHDLSQRYKSLFLVFFLYFWIILCNTMFPDCVPSSEYLHASYWSCTTVTNWKLVIRYFFLSLECHFCSLLCRGNIWRSVRKVFCGLLDHTKIIVRPSTLLRDKK